MMAGPRITHPPSPPMKAKTGPPNRPSRRASTGANPRRSRVSPHIIEDSSPLQRGVDPSRSNTKHRQQRRMSYQPTLEAPIRGVPRCASLTMPSALYFSPSAQSTSFSSTHPYEPSSPTQISPLGRRLETAMIGVPHPPIAPPDVNVQRQAMEAAAAMERQRAKGMEREEVNMTADELRAVLRRERNRQARMAADLACLKSGTVQSQLQMEVSEEGRVNELMRRADSAKQEKERFALETKVEGEMENEKMCQSPSSEFPLEKQFAHEAESNARIHSKLRRMHDKRLTNGVGLE